MSCNDPNGLGMDLLPSTDLINVHSKVIREDISAFTHVEDSIKTDEATNSLLGSINDPVFGNTTVDFATQFRLVKFPEYGTNPVVDSVKFYLYYRYLYGDTVTPQKIRIYELESSINYDATYKNEDLKEKASNTLLGEYEFIPKVELDSTTADTIYQLLAIPIDPSLGEKLISADSLDLVNNDVFLQFFKGLYIETEKVSGDGGTILTLEATTNSALVVYYNNDSNRQAAEPDTMSIAYYITDFSARLNRFNHDYSGTAFENHLNSETEQDSLIYIQATGGLQSKIQIANLEGWNDSVNVAINKAELIFEIDTLASEIDKFPPPNQLLFTIIDEDGKQYLPKDYVFSPTFYGGSLRSDYTYRFNITQHLQQIIDGETGNHGFYLTTALKNSEAKRVVLKGSTSGEGIKLVITYSKFLQ